VALAASSCASAQDDAEAPLRIIVPLPAGSTSDVVARSLAEGLREELGRPVIVDNRPGASGRIAVDVLRSAPPDGNTLLLAPTAVTVMVPLVSRVDYDPQKDLVPVAQVSRFEFALVVAPGHPARNLREFVAWAVHHPKAATYGSPGAGGGPHLIGAVLAKDAGFEFLHVPYKGAGGVEVDVMNGRIAAGSSALSDFIGLGQAGRLRILATSGRDRSPLLPDVPTFREEGYPELELAGWHGVFAPAGTRADVVDRLAAAIGVVLPGVAARDHWMARGLHPQASTPDELRTIITEDIERWRRIVQKSGAVFE
jgi:tripartite-type tricarboxylate transporter receptor subunit TctC